LWCFVTQLLLDSEGIDAYDQRAQDGVQLLSLAVLLSSTFVFNQMGPIDEAALDKLSLVTQITKHVRVRAGGHATGAYASKCTMLIDTNKSRMYGHVHVCCTVQARTPIAHVYIYT
jgi:Guanylate-binding protein, N-terminal domain